MTYTCDDDGNQTTENRGGVTTGYVYDDEKRGGLAAEVSAELGFFKGKRFMNLPHFHRIGV